MTWKKINGYNNYSINEFGEVRNDSIGKIKTPFENKANGYMTIDLWQNNKSKKHTIHRLLAEAFLPNPENKPTVDHKDGNRKNNSLSNLRWATYSEQNSRFRTVGVRSERVKVIHYPEVRKKRGGGHEAWLEPDDVMYFDRITDVANYFGKTIGNISQLLKSETIGKRGTTRGYKFEYVDNQRRGYERVTTIESTPEGGSE